MGKLTIGPTEFHALDFTKSSGNSWLEGVRVIDYTTGKRDRMNGRQVGGAAVLLHRDLT